MKQTKSHLFGTPDAKEIENKVGKHLRRQRAMASMFDKNYQPLEPKGLVETKDIVFLVII